MPPHFVVHSFHININVGDCAIHLLVDDNISSTQPKPIVYKAVLIDGGLPHRPVLSKITDTITELENRYIPDPAGHFGLNERWLRFDAIIVTHFDQDHYGGVQLIIKEGFEEPAEQAAALVTLQVEASIKSCPPATPPAARTKWIKETDAVSKPPDRKCWVQNRFMKYSTPVTGFNDIPDSTDGLLTTLYLPYFIGPTKAIDKCTFTCNGYTSSACWKTGTESCNVLDLRSYSVHIPQITSLPPNMSKSDGKMLKTGKYFNLDFCNICKLVATETAYLGAEVFFNAPLASVAWGSVQNPGQLVKAHNLKLADGPRMYIVAGLQKVLGNKQTLVTAGRAKGPGADPFNPPAAAHAPSLFPIPPLHNGIASDAVAPKEDRSSPSISLLPVRSKPNDKTDAANSLENKPINAFHAILSSGRPPPGAEGVLDDEQDELMKCRDWRLDERTGHSAPMNSASICCMILYKTTDNATVNDASCVKALHYVGGDALWDVESAIAKWATPPGTTLDIEAMKLSHHGAMAALPIDILDSFKPKRIICSSGNGGSLSSKYGHPRSETMLYLAPWLRKWRNADNSRPLEAIFLTNFPGYFNVRNSKSRRDVGSLRAWFYDEKKDKDGTSAFSVWRSNLWALCKDAAITNQYENVLEGWIAEERFNDTESTGNKNINQDILADAIIEIFKIWSGGANATNLKKGTAMDPDHVPRYIELRLSTNPADVQVNVWQNDTTDSKFPFEAPTPTPVLLAANRKRVRLVAQRLLTSAKQGPRKRPTAPIRSKRLRDSSFGVLGDTASPKNKDPRLDTFAEQVDVTTTHDDGMIIDCDEEAGGPLVYDTENSAMNNVMNVPMGLQSLHRNTGVNGDPFATGSNARMTRMLTPALTPTSDGLYRFHATCFQTQNASAGSKEVILSGISNTKFDDFVNTLPVGYLTCDDPGTSSTQPTIYHLSADDEWMQQLTATNLGFSDFSLSGTVKTSPDTQPLAWATVQISSLQASLRIKEATIDFTSATSSVVCGLPATTSSYVDAFLDTHTILSLGITSVTPTLSVSLKDLVPEDSILTMWAALFSLGDLNLGLDTSAGSRTALSFQPGIGVAVWRRLQLLPGDPNWTLSQKLPFLKDLGITFSQHQFILSSQVNVLRNTSSATAVEDHKLSVRTLVQIAIPDTTSTFNVTMWWLFDDNTANLLLCFDKDQDIEGIVKWIVSLLNKSQGSTYTRDDVHPNVLFANMPNTKPADGKGPAFFIQRISLAIDVSTSRAPSFRNFTMVLEVDLFGAAFQVAISGPPVSLSANLWSVIPDSSIYPTSSTTSLPVPYVPFLEAYETLHPFGAVSGEIQLSQLIGSDNTSSRPMGIQAVITDLSLGLRRSNGSTVATFNGTILCDGPSSSDEFPHLNIALFSIHADYKSSSPASQSSYNVKFSTIIHLFDLRTPQPTRRVLPVALEVSAEVSDGTWTFNATATELNFAALYQILDKDANSSIVDVLSEVDVTKLDVTYIYSKTSPKQLSVKGTLVVGSLELEMIYLYTAADPNATPATKKSWSIEAFLGEVGEQTHTIGSVMIGLDPDVGGFLEQVPFVRDCVLPTTPSLDEIDAGGFVDAPIQLFCSSNGDYMVMCFRIEISTPAGALSCTCVRFQPIAVGNVKSRPQPKLILRISLDKLPSIPNIPVVGSIPQPVDDIDYLFVRDPSTAAAGPFGISDVELAAVNTILVQGHFAEIPFRQVQSSLKSSGSGSSSNNTPNYVLLAGHHFMVRAEGRVIVDHLFGSGNGPAPKAVPAPKSSVPPPQFVKPSSSTQLQPMHSASAPSPRSAGIGQQETTTTSGAMKKSFVPLTVTNFGIQIKNGFLYLILDLTIAMGPVELTVIGFGVGVSLSTFNLNQLAHLSVDDFSIILSGMSVYCNAPPVLIGGVFIHQDDATAELYEGGLTVSIPPYTLVAVGAYRRAKPDGFKSVFVFARFDGPLLSLEFAEISGVEAGFGYNYDLTMPRVENVLDYPLLHSQTGTNNPMDILTQFGTWSRPKDKHFWFAIGCKIDSFELISMDAAIMIAFSTDGDFRVGLAGLATASMPPMVTKREEAFLYVELGVIGAIDIGLGALWIEAQLTPNSFILYPDCHLTGGFALCYWFHPSPYEGDWVFTVGGFHPAFKAPSYYPKVDRVGISWNLSDCLKVSGGAFFAITPNAAMAGGTLKATFDAWFVSAYFEAWAMMLIKFKPLYFIADIGVSIGCRVRLGRGILDIGFNIDISGSLHLTGPRFGGTVYVDLKVHTFSIDFGDQDGSPDPLDWPTFLNTVRQSGPKAAASGEITDLIIALVDGSATEKTESTLSTAATTSTTLTPSTWFVRSGTFVFRVESKVPVDSVVVDDGTPTGRNATASSNPTPTFARLMENTVQSSLNSALEIIVKPTTAAADADNNPWQLTPVIKSLPLGLWDKYSSSQDPIRSGNNIADQLNASDTSTSARHCIGYIVTAPKPALPLPVHTLPEFNAVAAMEEGVFADGGHSTRKNNRPLVDSSISGDERPHIIKADGTNSLEFYSQARPAKLTKPVDLWKNVHDTWAAANTADAQIIADAWTDIMGWADPKNQVAPIAPASGDTTTPPVFPTPPFTPLQAGAPSVVLEQFNDYFLGLPQVCQAVA